MCCPHTGAVRRHPGPRYAPVGRRAQLPEGGVDEGGDPRASRHQRSPGAAHGQQGGGQQGKEDQALALQVSDAGSLIRVLTSTRFWYQRDVGLYAVSPLKKIKL